MDNASPAPLSAWGSGSLTVKVLGCGIGVECFQLPPLLEVGAYDVAYQHDDEGIAHGYFRS